MASLLDIGPLTEEVEIRGVKLTIRGLSAKNLFQLISEFPGIRKKLEDANNDVRLTLMSLAPEVIGKIVAMASGLTPSDEVNDKVLEMSPDDLLNILEAVQRLSLPNGIGPFVDRVTALMEPLTEVKSMKTVESTPSMTKSAAPFSASLLTDTPPGMRGHSRRVN